MMEALKIMDSIESTSKYCRSSLRNEVKFDIGFYRLPRVPEEKQMMFLPGIVEEEEEENRGTPRTSTASLTNPSDSPRNERR